MADSSYSFSLTTFSPSGKLGQIEHALKAVQAGKTSLGIQGACSRGGAPSAEARARRVATRDARVCVAPRAQNTAPPPPPPQRPTAW
jgi:hypothetical protein